MVRRIGWMIVGRMRTRGQEGRSRVDEQSNYPSATLPYNHCSTHHDVTCYEISKSGWQLRRMLALNR